MSTEINLLLDIIEQAFQKKSWHGTNLLGSVRRLSMESASWRPVHNRHNIWEHVVHCAYWKYSVARRLVGGERGSFPLKGSNWFVRPIASSEAAWKNDLQLLKNQHEELVKAVREMPGSRLEEVPKGSSFSYQGLITGVAAHDLYHTGQIQLLKRLQQKEDQED